MTPDLKFSTGRTLSSVRHSRSYGKFAAAVETSSNVLRTKDMQPDVPLRVSRELAVNIIRTERYQHRDEISLILEAREYIKGRLPVRDRAMAVAILLQRDAVSPPSGL